MTGLVTEQAAIFAANPRPAKEIADKVITPNLAEIQKKLGQECDVMYLAYACEYVLDQCGHRRLKGDGHGTQ